MQKAILTPCIGVCSLDAAGFCTGCFRTVAEIAQWSAFSDTQRLTLIRDVLPEREQEICHFTPSSGVAGAAR